MLRGHARQWTFWGCVVLVAGIVFLLVRFWPVVVAGFQSIPNGGGL
jgi:hypothetical protein